jgi:FADH2-dependent halogenase
VEAERYDCDVAVIGGGPAGSSAAAGLAQHGRRVVLLERDRFPRFHIGESLLATVNGPLDRLGLREEMARRDFPIKWGANFLVADGSIDRYADFSLARRSEIGQPQTWQVRRADFDAMLLDAARRAGADVRIEHRVTDVAFDPQGVTVGFLAGGLDGALRARAVVDASGRSGVLARKFSLREDEPRLANIGIFAHYEGIERPVGRRSGDIRIVGRAKDLGWFWLIPVSSTITSVGVVLRRPVFDAMPRRTPEETLAACIADTPAVAAALAGATRVWPVRVEADFSYASRRYAGDRFLLAGDAGSFLDPVFSTGVAIALESGFEAADTLDRALGRGELAANSFRAFERRQRRRYLSFRRFVLAFYTHSFRDLFFQPGAGSPLFRAVVTQLAGRWRPHRVSTRFLISFFFLLVKLQRRFALVPRLTRMASA